MLFCSIAVGRLTGEPIQLQGSKIVLPEGNTIGAAISDKLIFIQQSVFHADGPAVRVSRRLLSWSVTTNSVVKERMLGADESVPAADDCGRIEAIDGGRHILVCANYETLVILDGDSLARVSSIHCDQKIYDFAVDDVRKRVLVASGSDRDIQYLTMFDMVSGKQLAQTRTSSGALDTVQIAVDSRTKRVAIAESRLEHSGYKTNLYGCTYAETMNCEYTVTLRQVSQIDIWGAEVFLASGLLADDRHICLTSVNLSSHLIEHRYCDPQTGVHYGVGVLDGKYVVAYTGVGKSLAWKEVTLTASNSVSVWKYESGTVAAKDVQEGADGPFQRGVRIACSKAATRFLLYSETSNIGYVYSINEGPG
jgi:hypothetical protein